MIKFTKLETAILLNLAFYLEENGWKDKKAIKETDYYLTMKYHSSTAKYTSDFNNLHNTTKRLISKNIIQTKKVEFKDKKNRNCKKVVWRLSKNKKAFFSIYEGFMIAKPPIEPFILLPMEIFQESNYMSIMTTH